MCFVPLVIIMLFSLMFVPLSLTATSDRFCTRSTYNNGQFINFFKSHVLVTPFIFLNKNCCRPIPVPFPFLPLNSQYANITFLRNQITIVNLPCHSQNITSLFTISSKTSLLFNFIYNLKI